MNYLDLENSRGAAEDHMAELQGRAKVQRMLSQSQKLTPASSPTGRRGLLQWLAMLLQPRYRPDTEPEPRYRHRST